MTPRPRHLVLLAVPLLLLLAACGKEAETTGTGSSGGGSGSGTTTTAAAGVTVDGSATFTKMTDRGKVIIGVKEDQPNLGYKDPTTGTYSGFDIEMANLVAAQLGFGPDQIEYQAIQSANREQAIINGDIDYYVGTYSITDKRKDQIGFAGPYFIAGQDLLVAKDDTTITGPDTLTGKRVCSVTGSTPIQRIKDEHPEATVVEFEKYSQCVDALLNGQADAVTTDDAILLGYAAQQPEKLKVVGAPFSTEKYGIGVAKDDTAFREKVNDILAAAEADGQWQSIYDETLGKSGSTAEAPPLERY
jgi:glutamate transport system substrate-binding protein